MAKSVPGKRELGLTFRKFCDKRKNTTIYFLPPRFIDENIVKSKNV